MKLTLVGHDRLEGYGASGQGTYEEMPPRWKTYAWTKPVASRAKREFEKTGEKQAFYRVTRGENWWIIDDLARTIIGKNFAYGMWAHTTQEDLERLKLAFRMLGLDDRLQLRENPEWAFPYNPTHVKEPLMKRAWEKDTEAS